MQLSTISDMSLNSVSLELIKEVHELAEQVDRLRPIPDEVLEKVRNELIGRSVYNSNAIEGNTLTLRETIRILETGDTIGVGRKREATEVVNLGQAIKRIQNLVDQREDWSNQEAFNDVHRILMDALIESPGVPRREDVMIGGAKYQPPGFEKISHLLEGFFDELKLHTAETVDTDPVKVATWVHWAIARIHPFVDGNGRMARLWQDLILFGNHLTSAIILQQDRNEYYEALTAADDKDFNPLCQLIARSLSANLNIYLSAQREVDELKDWARDLVGETRARLDEERRLEYLKWTRGMAQFRDAFQRCASQVTSQADGSIEIQIRTFDLIDQSTWEILRSGSSAGKTWFFWAHFRRDNQRRHYCFFFGRHMYSALDQSIPELKSGPCLLLSEEMDDENAERVDFDSEIPLRFRELLIQDGGLLLKQKDQASGDLTYIKNADPVTVAREFVQDVLLTRFA